MTAWGIIEEWAKVKISGQGMIRRGEVSRKADNG